MTLPRRCCSLASCGTFPWLLLLGGGYCAPCGDLNDGRRAAPYDVLSLPFDADTLRHRISGRLLQC
ncbi:MAG: hypothetical protein HC915_21640 [Anaerolineae bacterium]|nr:hypothetical protein [Anaerolineae bacterium]